MADRTGETLNVLSLCSGGGGLDLGLRLAVPTARTVCYVEREAFACEVLATAMQAGGLDEAPLWTDLRTFDGRPWRGVVDCIVGGYPCQPFSLAGRRCGSSDPRHLWPDVARIVDEVRPGLCFFENVSGHLSLGFREVAEDLEQLGYEVAAGLFTASEVGASHKRERLFILAVAVGAGAGGEAGEVEGRRQSSGLRPGDGAAGPVRPNSADGHVANAATTEWRGAVSRGREGQGAAAGGAGQAVADAENVGLQGVGRTGPSCGKGLSDGGGGTDIPIFPPGPGDLDGWRAVLDSDPTLEPAVCGVADGLGCRVHQLRLLGNGVVTVQAAYAFMALWAALRKEIV